ncbi:hypothetical protein TPB0596_37240 [Tsukamurella pulmonis]|uniref:hypothetical protein n=1 Tax=Tsukamurella pulmonis TaxID=47312 RepID=UPI001EDE4AA2|nr:hypothetical protein [Tsukamurella pulmonis]BDD83961.1 hypothetical protein TPB0596_37240 [Tsukamurella pulmonis]
MSTTLTVTLLAVLTTAGLVGAVATDGTASLVLAVATVVVAGVLAVRLRSAPPGAAWAGALATGIVIVSAGVPATIVLTESGRSGSPAFASSEEQPIDPSEELRSVLAKAEEIQPGSTRTIRQISISQNWTQMRFLDLTRGEEVSFQYSRVGSTHEWNTPSRSSTPSRAADAFSAADIAGLDLRAATTKVDGAIATLGVKRTASSSDDIEIGRRSGDQRLVATFHRSPIEIEVDPSGALPDNLALAKTGGMLPIAERLLRANGFDPAARVIDRLEYRVFAENVSSVGSGKGTVELSIAGAGRTGKLAETVGKFPEIDLRPSSSSSETSFPLSAVRYEGIEKARTDLVQRFSVLPIDAFALGLRVSADTRTSSRVTPPTVMEVGLGPNSSAEAYYALDGRFLRTD